MSKKPRAYAGQALVEYLGVIVVIALVRIPAMLFLNQAQQGLFDANAEALNAPMFDVSTDIPVEVPTATPTEVPATETHSPYNEPTTTQQCKNGGWRTFDTPDGTFNSQSQCANWVRNN